MYCLLRYSQKTGKVDTCMTGFIAALLKYRALNSTTKTKETVIVDLDAEEIIFTATGTANGWPEIDKEKRSAAACGITPEFMADMRRLTDGQLNET